MWYKNFGDRVKYDQMVSEFEAWRNNVTENELVDNFDKKLEEVAENYGFDVIKKTAYHYVFGNDDKEIVTAWHNDHDASWSIEDEGFDAFDTDLKEHYENDLLSEKDMVDIFQELHKLTELTKKQQQATSNILEYYRLDDKDKKYFDKTYSPSEYQNIYHNVCKDKKLEQKMVLRSFLEFLGFC